MAIARAHEKTAVSRHHDVFRINSARHSRCEPRTSEHRQSADITPKDFVRGGLVARPVLGQQLGRWFVHMKERRPRCASLLYVRSTSDKIPGRTTQIFVQTACQKRINSRGETYFVERNDHGVCRDSPVL